MEIFFNVFLFRFIYIHLCEKWIYSDRMYVERGRMKERYMFDGLFICQRVSTSRFYLNTKFIHDYNRYFFIQLNQKIIDYNYFSYKNNFDKIFLHSDKTLKSKRVGK